MEKGKIFKDVSTYLIYIHICTYIHKCIYSERELDIFRERELNMSEKDKERKGERETLI